jgi:hypothetical protein
VISRTGLWKRYLVGGMVLTVTGLFLLGSIDDTTSLVRVGAFMAVLGIGLGATMQNLVLAVQNNTAQRDMALPARSSRSSARWAARSESPCWVRCSATRSLLSHLGLARLGVSGSGSGASSIPDLASLPAPVRAVFEAAYGQGIGTLS